MSPEENKAIVKKFYQLIEENNYDALKDLCHPDFRFYSQIDHPLSADEFIRQEKQLQEEFVKKLEVLDT